MKKIVCELCESTDFVKVDGRFVCQGCGCKYSAEEARKLMQDCADEPARTTAAPKAEPEQEPKAEPQEENRIPLHTVDSPNKLFAKVLKVGHETYTAASVVGQLFGDPEPVFVEGPDQVGHIGVEVFLQNIAGKVIKYAFVHVVPMNAVGDPVECTVQGHSSFECRITGPVAPGETYTGHVEGAWYNFSIVTAKIEKVHVIYMDNTEELYDGTEFYAPARAEDAETPAENAGGFCNIDVTYEATAGAAGELWYIWNNETVKRKLLNGRTVRDVLIPGKHHFTILNPFMKKTYELDVQTDKPLLVKGKSFGMEVFF